MAFAAGVLLGVVSFDIFPEIIEQIKIYNFNKLYNKVSELNYFFLDKLIAQKIT